MTKKKIEPVQAHKYMNSISYRGFQLVVCNSVQQMALRVVNALCSNVTKGSLSIYEEKHSQCHHWAAAENN